MPIHIRFYVYQGTNRQRFHYLQADRQVASLDEFLYGQPLWITQPGIGSNPQAYVVVDLPIGRESGGLGRPIPAGYDIYLAPQAQAAAFTGSLSIIRDLPYGPSL